MIFIKGDNKYVGESPYIFNTYKAHNVYYV